MDDGDRDRPREGHSDEELVATLSSGSAAAQREALGLLFERHHGRVLAYCEQLLGDRSRAEDATHEVFLALPDRLAHYRERRSFGAWLYVVARNHCLNLLRRSRREEKLEDHEQILSRDDGGQEAGQIATRILVERICAERLNLVEQQVIHLRYAWGMSVKQIDVLLGLTNVSGARSHLATATRKLREALAPLGRDEGEGSR